MRKASDLDGNPFSNPATAAVDNAIGRYTQGWVSPVKQRQTDPDAQKFDALNTKLDSMQATSQGQSAQTAPTATAALPAPAAPAATAALPAPNPLAQRPAATSFAGLGIRGPRPAPSKPAVGSVRINTPRPQGFGNFGIQGPQAPVPNPPVASVPRPPSPAAPKPPAVTGAQPAAPKAPRMNTGQGKARIQAGITQKLGIPRTANAAAGVASSVLRLRRALSNASS